MSPFDKPIAQLRAQGFKVNLHHGLHGIQRATLVKDGEAALALFEELADLAAGNLTLQQIAGRRAAESAERGASGE